jgi:hypothetical protein
MLPEIEKRIKDHLNMLLTPEIKKQINDHFNMVFEEDDTQYLIYPILVKNEGAQRWCDAGIDMIVFFSSWDKSEIDVLRYYYGPRTEYRIEENTIDKTEILTRENAEKLWHKEVKYNGYEKINYDNGVPSHSPKYSTWRPDSTIRQVSLIKKTKTA